MNTTKHMEELREGIYIVNHSYEIIYLDDKLSVAFSPAQKGNLCYKVLRGKARPCKDCPLKKFKSNKSAIANEIIYNELIKHWVYCTMLKIRLPEYGECTVIMMKKIIDEKRGLFINFDDKVNYDILIELNAKQQKYKLLDGKFKNHLKAEGTITSLISETRAELVTAEKQNQFLQFIDLQTLPQKTEKLGHIVEDFHLLQGGEYHWYSFYLNAVTKTKKDDYYLWFIVNVDHKYGFALENETPYQKLNHLTGLFTTLAFYERVDQQLHEDSATEYGLVVIDIEHFKLFNDWYGTNEGDKLLVYMADKVSKKCKEYKGIAARLGGDDFAMLLPYEVCEEEHIEQEITSWMQNYEMDIKFLPAAGIYKITTIDMPVTLMCDRAVIALQSVKGNYAKRTAVYNQAMKQKLENEQEVLSGVKEGLSRHEFEVYYQPQCSARTNRIIGAEALVRWNHPQKGLLYPNEFIPILESSGFISKLDYYVWKEVAIFLHQRIMEGKVVVPISVNVSRLDMYQYQLAKVFQQLCNEYELTSDMLQIEITESAYMENFNQLIQTISQLRELGFTILMDDFGSGYSSLNMLKDIEVDVIKLDMKFLKVNQQSLLKGSGILESMIHMGKWLGLRLIAEGVETAEQLDQLLNLDCEYMQGYYFYRPLSTSKFNALLNKKKLVDERGILAKRLPTIKLDDLFHKDITSEAMLSNILGGVALYELYPDGHFVIKMVNDRYYRMTGCNSVDLMERSNSIIKQIYKDDVPIVKEIFAKAESSSSLGAEGTFRRYRLNGEIMWMHLHAYFLRKQGDVKVFYGAVSDYSVRMNLEQELMTVLDNIPGNIMEYRVDGNTLHTRIISAGLASVFGCSKEQYETILTKSNGMAFVCEEDLTLVQDMIDHLSSWKEEFSFEYRAITQDNSMIWLEQRMRQVGKEEQVRIYYCLCTDITKLKNQEKELLDSQKILHSMLTSINDVVSEDVLKEANRQNAVSLYAKTMPSGMIGGYCEEGYPIYFANDEIIKLLGYDSYQDLIEGIHGQVEQTIYQEDRQQTNTDIGETFYEGLEYTTQYRMVKKDGSLFWVIDKGRVVKTEDGRLAIISTCMDID